MLPKINLEHLSFSGLGGLRSSSIEAPDSHETNFNTQCYNDAIDLTSRWKVRFRQTFFQNEAQKVLYKPVLVSDLISFFLVEL